MASDTSVFWDSEVTASASIAFSTVDGSGLHCRQVATGEMHATLEEGREKSHTLGRVQAKKFIEMP